MFYDHNRDTDQIFSSMIKPDYVSDIQGFKLEKHNFKTHMKETNRN